MVPVTVRSCLAKNTCDIVLIAEGVEIDVAIDNSALLVVAHLEIGLVISNEGVLTARAETLASTSYASRRSAVSQPTALFVFKRNLLLRACG